MPTVTKDKPEPVRWRGRYPKEYRRDVRSLVLDQKRSVASVAKELGVAEQIIYLWLRQERTDRGEAEGLSTSEREELSTLRKENRRLLEERDLLKKWRFRVLSGLKVP
jgi:transposase